MQTALRLYSDEDEAYLALTDYYCHGFRDYWRPFHRSYFLLPTLIRYTIIALLSRE